VDNLTRRDVLKIGAAGVVAGLGASGCAEMSAGPQRVAAGAAPLPLGAGEPLKVAFIGVGGRGGGLLNAFLKLKGQQVVAICDINKDNLNRAIATVEKAQNKAPAGYGNGPDDFQRVLDRKDIHAIVTATPCFEHPRIMLATIQAGKHIYGEKPLALTVRDADAILAASEANRKLVVQVGFQWMCNPNFADCISRVHKKEIGEPVEGRFFRHNAPPIQMVGWFEHRDKSGDWVLEQACHEFNLMNWAAQATPLQAYGMGRRDLYNKPVNGITNYYATIIEYPNNFIVHYAHGWISPAGFQEMGKKIIGTKGATEIGGSQISMVDKNVKVEPLRKFPGDDTEEALRCFVESIREGKPAKAPVANGRNASLLALMVRKAVDERRVVTWNEMLRTC
jgi:myo-inositol 2-dehydrogenase/D-chiro-inositol 1-dehydrogenase